MTDSYVASASVRTEPCSLEDRIYEAISNSSTADFHDLSEEALRNLAMLAARACSDGWQDISTAPYGPEILVGYSNPNGVSACFTSIRRSNGVFVVTNSAWDARTHDYATCSPTHWKPLGSPPVGSGPNLADAIP